MGRNDTGDDLARLASGSASLGLAVSTREAMVVQCSRPPSEPAKCSPFVCARWGGSSARRRWSRSRRCRRQITGWGRASARGRSGSGRRAYSSYSSGRACLASRLEAIHGQAGFLLAHGTALLGRSATALELDAVELCSPDERLGSDRRLAGGDEFVEAAAHMGQQKTSATVLDRASWA